MVVKAVMALSASGALLAGLTVGAFAQASQPGEALPGAAPGVMKDGSANTRVGGVSAARSGDGDTAGGKIVGGSKNVFINGKPAARVGDKTNCGGIVVSGSSNVFVNGRPLARTGDVTTPCQ